MSAFSQSLEQSIVGWLRGSAFPAAPASLTIGLHTASPLDDNSGGAEVSAGGYARKTLTLAAPTSSNGSGTVTSNSADIVFGPASANWGTVSHWAVYTNGGTMVLHGAFTTPRSVLDGEGFDIPAGSLQLTVR